MLDRSDEGSLSEARTRISTEPTTRKSLTKIDVVSAVARRLPNISRREARAIVDAFFDEVAHALLTDGEVRLRDFGSFYVREKGERPGRNPRTGVGAAITARRVLTFQASPRLKACVERGAVIQSMAGCDP